LFRIPVKTASRSYDVLIERGLLARSADALKGVLSPHSRVFVVTSKPVAKHWGKALLKGLAPSLDRRDILVMPDGERAKRLDRVEKLAENLVDLGADRKSVLIALGGGVVGDVGGFLASVFMRGVPVVQLPTTLVAQVDSAIGGKTGVNLTSGKNLVGTFHQPSRVLIDPDVLSTLPEREYRSGLFEAMKYGIIRNPQIFDLMEKERKALLARDSKLLENLIADCIQVKADVVSADERESGERAILNYGHTIGHALEAETGYTELLHGEAVGWGMIAAARIGEMTNISDKKTTRRILDLVQAYGHLPRMRVKPKRILKRLTSDKKTVGGRPHFVLARTLGDVATINNVPDRVIFNAVEELNELAAG
jgi:3-dehydroquinate synthase